MEFVKQEKIVHHTVFLEYFNITEEELSNFAFQSFSIFIGTLSKKNAIEVIQFISFHPLF